MSFQQLVWTVVSLRGTFSTPASYSSGTQREGACRATEIGRWRPSPSSFNRTQRHLGNRHRRAGGHAVPWHRSSRKSDQMSRPTFSLWRDESGGRGFERSFSKLKVIGERLGELDDKTRKQGVVKGSSRLLFRHPPPLCPETRGTGHSGSVRTITPKTSVRAATAYIKQGIASHNRHPKKERKDAGARRRKHCSASAALTTSR